MNEKKINNPKDAAIYLGIVVFSLLFLFLGHRIAAKDLRLFDSDGSIVTVEAVVTAISDRVDSDFNMSDGTLVTNTDIIFEARITRGPHKNETVTAAQNLSSYFIVSSKEIREGDKVILFDDGSGQWGFMDYLRIYRIMALGAVFILLLLLFGGMKGFNALLALGLTCVSVFAIFIPSVLTGGNIRLMAIIVCAYSIVATLLIVNGICKKSISAIIGCFGGVIATGVISFFMDKALLLTGVVDQETQFLLYLELEKPIDLHALIFAAIIIGAVGAVMDVSISISSALWEIKQKAADASFQSLFESGINVGRDVMGTMANTLILAYIGSSMSVVLLFFANSYSALELVNREMIIVELLQMLAGSLGILLTMPLTALSCAFLYTRDEADGDIDYENTIW